MGTGSSGWYATEIDDAANTARAKSRFEDAGADPSAVANSDGAAGAIALDLMPFGCGAPGVIGAIALGTSAEGPAAAGGNANVGTPMSGAIRCGAT